MTDKYVTSYPGFSWSELDYTPVFLERARRLATFRTGDPAHDAQVVANLKAYYKEHPADFINDWGMTVDPRNAEIGKETTVPFVLFPKQREFIEWLHARWRAREDGVCEKSREMGVSWLCVAFGDWMFLFHSGSVFGIGSRKEEYVDNGGDPKSLFWKSREFLSYLPAEFRPAGFSLNKHSASRRIINPENGASIIGEAGLNIGRGNRTSAQPLHSKILTPTGWSTMGEMRVGSQVIGSNGKATTVTHIHPKGTQNIYRVNFCDGSSTLCCGEHLWEVYTANNRKSSCRKAKNPRGENSGANVKKTEDLIDKILVKRSDTQTQYNLHIPVVGAVEFESRELPIHPYIVGCLIGDGSVSNIKRSTVGFTSADPYIVDRIGELLPSVCEIKPDGNKYGFRITDKRGQMGPYVSNPVKKMLFDVGLAGKKSNNKFIPDLYKFADVESRLEILRGIMDTDGWVKVNRGGKSCQIMFCSTSKQLIDDVVFIVRSLGGVVGEAYKTKPSRRLFPHGKFCDTVAAYNITLTLPDGVNPFSLPRKVERVTARSKYKPKRAIVSIEREGQDVVQCITVAASDGLYVTDDLIVTHNCYVVDEAAFIEGQETVDASLSQTSNCKISVSTPNGNGNVFFRKRFGGKIPVFTFRWQDDPRKGEAWYRKQQSTLDPVVLAQEVDIDYAASVSNAYISADLVTAANLIGPADIQAVGGWIIGVDAAHEGDDQSVIHSRRGRLNLPQLSFSKLDGPELAYAIENHCDDLVASTGAPIAGIVIELDGPGVSCYDQLKRGPYHDCVYGVHTGKKLKDNRHYNLRALLWARALTYLSSPPVCVAPCPQLRSQLASMLYSYRDGMLLMQDKKAFKKAFGRSPDNADAFVLTHYEVRTRSTVGGRAPVRVNLSHPQRRRSKR